MRERVAQGLDWLADHPWVTAALLAVLAAGGAALLALIRGIPEPTVHDEFSYWLAADTFASGRVTNPAHPFWQHFETFHVLQRPTYVSKYPPAQGLVLAFGQLLGGHPIVGVWLSIGLMVAAMYWMFRVWLPVRWALLGGLIVLFQLGISSYWAQSYWGGAVAATGGALLFGATRLLAEKPRIRDAVLMGIGLAILANSRPFEGFVVSIFAAAALGWFFFTRDAAYRSAFLRLVAVPVGMVLLITLAAMGAYNFRTTGDPLRMPYQVYSDAYAIGSFFPWKEPNLALEFRHAVMREFSLDWGLARLDLLRHPGSFALLAVTRTLHRAHFFFGAFALVLLLGLPRALRSGWIVFAASAVAVVWALSLFTTAYPHYLAPALCLGFVVCIESARRLTEKRHSGISLGIVLVGAALVVEVVLFGSTFMSPQYLTTEANPAKEAFADDRSVIIERLLDFPETDLVLVRYGPTHSYHRGWIHNRADIDRSEIVWARDMGESENSSLIDYFSERRVWLLTATGADSTSSTPFREHVVLEPYLNPPPR
jgi:hypothetical protein